MKLQSTGSEACHKEVAFSGQVIKHAGILATSSAKEVLARNSRLGSQSFEGQKIFY